VSRSASELEQFNRPEYELLLQASNCDTQTVHELEHSNEYVFFLAFSFHGDLLQNRNEVFKIYVKTLIIYIPYCFFKYYITLVNNFRVITSEQHATGRDLGQSP
jgi:hypothetical protein